MTHDQLQAKAFQWAHNTFPIIRGSLFAVQNEVPPHPGESKVGHIKRISHYKSIGLRSGALDLFLVCPGAPYGFDAKVGNDSLSDNQLDFIEILRRCGGDGFEFRSFEQFQLILLPIIKRHYGSDDQTAEILRRVAAGR
jgi:hypothetical protein